MARSQSFAYALDRPSLFGSAPIMIWMGLLFPSVPYLVWASFIWTSQNEYKVKNKKLGMGLLVPPLCDELLKSLGQGSPS